MSAVCRRRQWKISNQGGARDEQKTKPSIRVRRASLSLTNMNTLVTMTGVATTVMDIKTRLWADSFLLECAMIACKIFFLLSRNILFPHEFSEWISNHLLSQIEKKNFFASCQRFSFPSCLETIFNLLLISVHVNTWECFF